MDRLYSGEFVVGAVSLTAFFALLLTLILTVVFDDAQTRRFVRSCEARGGQVREVERQLSCVGAVK